MRFKVQICKQIITNLISETAGLLPAKYLSFKQRKAQWDVRENLFQHQMQLLMQEKKTKMKKKKQNIHQLLINSNEIDEGYQSDQPATNLE